MSFCRHADILRKDEHVGRYPPPPRESQWQCEVTDHLLRFWKRRPEAVEWNRPAKEVVLQKCLALRVGWVV